MNIEVWAAFTTIAFLATVIPGPAMLVVSTNSIRFGVFQSIKTILGNITGLAILSSISVAGLSTLIFYSSSAFTAIKIMGAFYLAFLGIKLWRSGVAPLKIDVKPTHKQQYLYLQGLVVSLSNPKAIAFTTALFPQFINPLYNIWLQFSLFLGTFMALSFSCLLACSIIAAKSSSQLSEKVSGYLGKVFGSLFIGSGAALLLTKQ